MFVFFKILSTYEIKKLKKVIFEKNRGKKDEPPKIDEQSIFTFENCQNGRRLTINYW